VKLVHSIQLSCYSLTYWNIVYSPLSAHQCPQAKVNRVLEGQINELALFQPASNGPAMWTDEQEWLRGKSEVCNLFYSFQLYLHSIYLNHFI
jgi:hypothetical protein